jgi:hypothetical protein
VIESNCSFCEWFSIVPSIWSTVKVVHPSCIPLNPEIYGNLIILILKICGDSTLIHDANLIQLPVIKCIVDLHSRLDHLLDKQMISCPGKCCCQKQPIQSTLFILIQPFFIWSAIVAGISSKYLLSSPRFSLCFSSIPFSGQNYTFIDLTGDF